MNLVQLICMETSFTPIGITQLFHKTCKVYLCTIPYLDYRAYTWWQKYLSACERVEGYLDREFMERVRSNVRRVR